MSPGGGSYETTLLELARGDERIMVLTAENRAAIRNVPQVLGRRFVDVGICEQTMVGMAAGLALRGRIPILHALSTFLVLRAFEFIRTDVGLGGLPVKLVGGVPGLLSEANGPTHQALDDLAVMRSIPGMSIVCPADEDDLCRSLATLVGSPGPVYLRHNPRPPRHGVHQPFVMGLAEPLLDGTEVHVLALGLLVPEVVEAAHLLRGGGLRVAVTNMRTLAPLDEAAVVAAARSVSLLVTVEDHFLVGGLYQAVTEILVRHGLGGVRVLPIGFPGRFFAPGLLADVLEHEGLSAPRLAARIASAWEGHRARTFHGPPSATPPLPPTEAFAGRSPQAHATGIAPALVTIPPSPRPANGENPPGGPSLV